MSWEDHVEWELNNQLSNAWEQGYSEAMRYAMKAVVGTAIVSPINPYRTEKP